MNAKFLFVGNRKFVLEEMLKQNCVITKVLVIKESYLQKDIKNLDINYEVIDSKKQLISYIHKIDFDIFNVKWLPLYITHK